MRDNTASQALLMQMINTQNEQKELRKESRILSYQVAMMNDTLTNKVDKLNDSYETESRKNRNRSDVVEVKSNKYDQRRREKRARAFEDM